MKNAKILETYEEIENAMFKGQDVGLKMVVEDNGPCEQSNYGETATIKPHTGDYVYTDGTFSEERDSSKELKGVALWVTDRRMITLWPDVPDEKTTYSETEKWCKENGRKMLDKDAMLAIFINRDVLKDKINLKDDCCYWIEGTEIDKNGDEYHRYLYIAPVFQGCFSYASHDSSGDSRWSCE